MRQDVIKHQKYLPPLKFLFPNTQSLTNHRTVEVEHRSKRNFLLHYLTKDGLKAKMYYTVSEFTYYKINGSIKGFNYTVMASVE